MDFDSDDYSPPATVTLPPPATPEPDSASRPAIFLDFDGTLVEIAPHPDAITVAEGLPTLLARLADRLAGRIAIISGRPLSDLDRFLGPVGIAMAGSHGGEFRQAGSGDVRSLADPIDPAVVQALRAMAEVHGGLLVEAKPFSAAIHYRQKPEAEADIRQQSERLAADHGLHVKHGKMVSELVMPGSDKGNAVAQFMEMPVFAGAHPLFVGDDVTDEDAFRQVRKHGGAGILVGPQRETAAQWRLNSVPDVHNWLETLLK